MEAADFMESRTEWSAKTSCCQPDAMRQVGGWVVAYLDLSGLG